MQTNFDPNVDLPPKPAEVMPAPEQKDISPAEAGRLLAQWRQQKREAAKQAEQKEAGAPEITPQEPPPAEHELAPPEANAEAPQAPIGETTETPEAETPSIEPPVSWSAEEKTRFAQLPHETQAYIAERERQRDAEISRRQNEFAEKARALEPERQALQQARTQMEQAAYAHLQALQTNSEFGDIRTQADVTNLARTDPDRYTRWHAHNEVIKQTQQQVQAMQAYQQQEHQAQFNAWAAEQDRKFAEKTPEFADQTKAKQLQQMTIDTLERDYGFTPEEMAQAWATGPLRDFRMQQIMLDAARYRALKKNPPKPAGKPVPPVQRPGAAKSTQSATNAELDKLNEKLSKTGRLDDAVSLLMARRAVR